MHVKGRYILYTSLPAFSLRLLVVITMILSSFSLNVKSVSADDGTPPQDSEELPTETPISTDENATDPTAEPVIETETDHTNEPTDEDDGSGMAGYECFALTVSHDGNGSDPIAEPLNSEGCLEGEFIEGEVISLTGAAPDEDWEISGWSGTDNDASTEASNTLVMPASTHEVLVHYSEINIVKAQDEGVEAQIIYNWNAYNDSYIATGEPSTNITSVAVSTSSSDNALINYADGTTLSGITLSVDVSSITAQNSDSYGGEAESGTDAYDTFHGIAQLIGGGKLNSESSYVYLTFSGLDPEKTYTFATTANRNDEDYSERISKFLITDVDAATNASTSGATRSTTDFTDDGTTFCTGYNYTTGYVARWTGIQPGSDGDFQIQATNASDSPSSNHAYIPAVFMLAEEITTTDPTIYTSGTLNDFNSSPGVVSDEQSYSVEAINLTDDLIITAPADFQISTSSGSDFGSLITLTPTSETISSTTIFVRFLRTYEGTSSGNITHTSTGAEEMDLAVSGTAASCTTVNLVASEDTYMSSYNTTNNYGATELFKVSTRSSSNRGALIRWDLSSIPSTATVSEASLTFYVSNAGSKVYNLYNMRRDWVEGTNDSSSGTGASWLYYDAGINSWGTEGAANTSSDRYDTNLWDAGTSTFSSTGSATVSLNSEGISVFQGWIDGTLDNYGLTIQNYSASSSSDDLRISSSENSTVENRPKLNLTYCIEGPATYNLTVGSGGNGSVTLSPSGGVYEAGTTVTLTPVPDPGFIFDSWTGTNAENLVDNGDGTYSITMDADKDVTANFAATTLKTLTVTVEGSGSVTLSPSGGAYDENTLVTLTPVAGSGYTFGYWGGTNAADLTNNGDGTYSITMTENKVLIAYFIEIPLYTLTVDTDGNGSVTISPEGPTYEENTVVTLTPVPNFNYVFSSWTGTNWEDVVDIGEGSYTITMYSDKEITANFEIANYAPNQPVLVQPANEATDVSITPTLEVTVTDPEAEAMDVTFYGRTASSVSGEDFTLIALPDTQYYSSTYTTIFGEQTQWIVDNESAENISFVIHLGDIVNTSSSTSQWNIADAAMDLLDTPDIPYSVGPGNHDIGTSSLYSNYFGSSRFSSKSYYGGYYTSGNDNYNNYSLFSASGMDFIVINLQYAPTTAILNWADDLLKTYSDRRAIVESHYILEVDNSWGMETIYDSLKDNPNLFLMLCGHVHTSTDGAAQRTETYDGNTVYILMSDYQQFTNGGNGYLRIMEFSPSEDEIEVKTYSPTLNSYLTDSDNAMALYYEMEGVSSFEIIGTDSGVVSGDSASVTWEGLSNATEYEWYAVASDGTSATTSDTWSFSTVSDMPNHDPVISESDPQSVSMSEDGSPTSFDLTLNAGDEDGDTLTWSIANAASHGSAGASGTGATKAIGYVPNENYNGTDSFIVQVSDGNGGVDSITVNVTISAVNDAPVANAQSVSTDEDTAKAITLTGSDVESSALTYTIVDSPQYGGLSGTPPNLTYTPNSNYHGADSFTFMVDDGELDSNTATVSITVTDINDLPEIDGDDPREVAMSEDGSPIAFNLTLNASDEDGDTLTWSIADAALNGSASVNGTGTTKAISYVPNENYNGTDNFTVQVSDGNGGVDSIMVNVTISAVNDAPVADAQSVSTEEDTAKAIILTGSDVESSTLTYTIVDLPQHGGLSGTPPNLTYTPDSNYSGADSFTFMVNDGELDSNPAEVSITVTDINDPPEIEGDDPREVAMSEDGSPIAFNLTLDASDEDSDTLTWSISSEALHGVASVDGTGTTKVIGYMPEQDYNGSDSFEVKVSDGSGGEDTVTVNVTIDPVSDLPVIAESDPLSVTMSEDGSPVAFSLTLNASDGDGDILTWSISSEASYGIASVDGTGTSKAISYTPEENYNGSDSFEVQVSDGNGGVDSITVNVTIDAVNDAPVCFAVSINTVKNTQGQVSPDCMDVEGDVLTYSIAAQPEHGAGSVVSDLLTYEPATDYSGTDSFTYQANDGEANSDAVEVTVLVSEHNHAPVCTAIDLTTDEDIEVQTDPVCTDFEGSPMTYSISMQPEHGSAEVVDGKLVYNPEENYNGLDSFSYIANDGSDDSEASAITVTINAINDVPVCADVSLNTYKNTRGQADPACTDVDGDSLTYNIMTQPSHSSASVQGGRLSYLPSWNYTGTDSFTYKADDGALESNVAAVNVDVSDSSLTTRAPSVPSLGSPSNKALVTDRLPNMDWSNSKVYSGTVFSHYQMQVAGDSDFIEIVLDEDVGAQASDSEYTLESELSPNTRYYWRVRAFNTVGQYSAWSTVKYFREAIEAPALAAPADSTYLDNLQPEYDWGAVEGASSYTFQISTKSSMKSASSKTVSTDSYIPSSDLSKNKTLYWRVRANGENGPSEWSEIWAMVTPNTPTTPKLASPKNKALVKDLMTRLDWSNSKVSSGTEFDHYQVQITTDEDFASLVLDKDVGAQASDSEYTLEEALSPNTRYYWRVRAFNTLEQYSSWSTTYYFREAMESPTLASPANATYLGNLRPEFGWEAVEGASSYTFQISARSSMKKASSKTVKEGDSYIPSSDLSKNRTLYWRVRANGENGPSEWSEIWTVVTPDTPTTPKPISPKNKVLLIDLLPTLDWSNSSVPSGTVFDHYQLQVATDEGFTSMVLDRDVIDSEYTLTSELSPNTRYYWRVRAFNTLGQYSSWSKAYYFREAMLAPELVAPEDGVELETLRPEFDWEAVEGASSYTFQISTRSSMKRSSKKTVSEDSYIPSGDLAKNKTLYWRVRANGENGPSEWSEIRMVVTPNTPTTPRLATPKNKALVTERMPKLDWSNSSVPRGTLFDHYQVQVATDSGFENIAVDENVGAIASDSEYTLTSELSPNTRYYWRVRGYNDLGHYSSWSKVYYFREAVDPPTLVAPVDGASPDDLRPEFSWEAVEGASSYTFQISGRSNMRKASSKTVSGESYVPTSDLSKNQTLYWRVRANGENGPSEWSEIWTIVTPNTPTTPKLSSPKNNALVRDLLPSLDWSNSGVPSGTVFDHYQLQVATDAEFASLVLDEEVGAIATDSAYTLVSELSPNTRYYWRVRAFNTLGQYSSWSKAYYFREAMLAPELLTPEEGAVLDTRYPEFNWVAAEGASSYTIQVSTRSNMKKATSMTASTNDFVSTKKLSRNQTLYWRVRANGDNGPSEWSEIRSMIIIIQ